MAPKPLAKTLAPRRADNPTTLLWNCEVPKQVCGRYASQFWSQGQMLVTLPPGFKIAGTLQCYAKVPQMDLHPLPAFSGLHFVCLAPSFSQTLGLALVCDPALKECRALHPDSVVIDDHRAIIESSAPRLSFLDE